MNLIHSFLFWDEVVSILEGDLMKFWNRRPSAEAVLLLSLFYLHLPSEGSCEPIRSRPLFSDYPTPVEGPKADTADFSAIPASRKYRTAISHALKDGVTFGGKYSVALWGCGTNCRGIAVVRTGDGKVVFYKEAFDRVRLDRIRVSSPLGLSFRKDSALLIVNPMNDDKPFSAEDLCDRTSTVFGHYGLPLYFLWKDETFRNVTPKEILHVRPECLSCCGDSFVDDRLPR